jgi:hypothetical protein
VWPFKKKPPAPEFKPGDKVWYRVITGGHLYAGVVVDRVDGEYVVTDNVSPRGYVATTRLWPRSC